MLKWSAKHGTKAQSSEMESPITTANVDPMKADLQDLDVLQEQHLIWFSSVQDVRTVEIKKQTALPNKQKEDLQVSDENLK